MFRTTCLVVAFSLASPAPAQTCTTDWVEQPSSRDYGRLYPDEAYQLGINAAVELDCLVGEDYHLTRTVLSEEPSGMGFAEASIELSRKFKVGERTSCGQSMIGAHIRRMIRWRT